MHGGTCADSLGVDENTGVEAVSKAERLFIAGDATGAAALAKDIFLSYFWKTLPDLQQRIALSVAIQSMASVGRFRELDDLMSQTFGGLQQLPTESLLLWCAPVTQKNQFI